MGQFSDLLAVHYISDNFALFAVELLIGLGAACMVRGWMETADAETRDL